jgi:N-glycosylase/DNA lyase
MKQIGENRFCVTAADRYVEIEQEGSLLTFYCSDAEFIVFWVSYFDLESDYQKYIDTINPGDKYLNKAVKAGEGIRILRQDLWEMIVSFLISQQNNITRIRRCIDNICKRYGEEKTAENGAVYYTFPTPEQLSFATEAELKECNLGYRAKYVLHTAKAVTAGEINLEEISKMNYKKAKEELLKIYGAGEKVTDCICLFALHHLDAFPVDTHIRQVLETHYKRGFPNRRYRGIRGVIQQYIFYYELIKTEQSNEK